jgi:outer membrane protein
MAELKNKNEMKIFRIKKIILLLVVIIVFSDKTFCQQKNDSATYSLQQCVEIAVQSNFTVKNRDLQVQTAQVNVNQARADLFPTLNATLDQGKNYGRSIDPYTNSYINQEVSFGDYYLTSGITLFHGLQLQNQIREDVLALEANKMQWQQAKDELTLDVLLAYLQIISDEQLLVLAQSQEAVTQKQVDRLNVMNVQGATAPFNLYDLKGTLATNELNITSARDALHQAKLTLAQYMGIPYSAKMEIVQMDIIIPAKYPDSSNMIYQKALAQLSEIKAVNLFTASAQKQVQATRGLYSPTLTLNGQLATNYSSAAYMNVFGNNETLPTGDYVVVNGEQVPVMTQTKSVSSEQINFTNQFKNNYNGSVGVGLSIPIFNSFLSRNQVQLAKINLKLAQNNEAETKLQLQQSVEEGYVDMQSAYDRFQTSAEQVNAFAESFREAEVRYNTGSITSVDYLIAKNNIDNANVNLLLAKYEYVFRTKVLDFYEGKSLW